MSIEEFLQFMKDHNLTIADLVGAYNQWFNYNYMSKTEIKYRLTLKEEKNND